MNFSKEELEMVQTIRDLCNDQTIDPYDVIEDYNEVINKFY